MAQTKRKRRSKHRGTAGGTIVARGRTGRKPTADELKAQRRGGAQAKRQNRYETPPTWLGAFKRAAIVTVVFLVLIVAVLNRHGSLASALLLIPIVLVLYTIMGYYTDLMIHRRFQRRKARAEGTPK